MDLPKNLHSERNWFTTVFSPMSRKTVNVDSGQPGLFFKMTWGGHLQVYTDESKSQMILECKRKGKLGMIWEVFDVVGGQKHLANIHWNVLKTAIKLGSERWKVTDPGGAEFLVLKTEGDSLGKRFMDSFLEMFYNPKYEYKVMKPGGELVAEIFAKHGWWKHLYDFKLSGGSAEEKKVALGLFAAMILMLKK